MSTGTAIERLQTEGGADLSNGLRDLPGQEAEGAEAHGLQVVRLPIVVNSPSGTLRR